MSNVRKINATQCQIFKDILAKLWSIIFNSCTFQRLDIIYDSYIEQSIKFSERQRWAITNGILVCNIEYSSYIPSQMEKFWACDRNEENLQLISRSFFIENASGNSKCLTLSGIIGDSNTCNDIQCIQYKDGITSNKESLDKAWSIIIFLVSIPSLINRSYVSKFERCWKFCCRDYIIKLQTDLFNKKVGIVFQNFHWNVSILYCSTCFQDQCFYPRY